MRHVFPSQLVLEVSVELTQLHGQCHQSKVQHHCAIVRRGGAATSRATQDRCMIIRVVQATTPDKVNGTLEDTTVDTTADTSNYNRRHSIGNKHGRISTQEKQAQPQKPRNS